MKKLILSTLLVVTMMLSQAQSFEGSKIGKGIRFMAKDSSFNTQLNVRFQNLYQGTYSIADETYNDKYLIRRFRLKFKGYAFNPKINYKIELALSNRDQKNSTPEDGSKIVLDAVVKYKFAKGWQFWAGQTKLPGNRERVISSKDLQFVDRSYLNSKFTIDRGKGFQLRHEHALGTVVLRQAFAFTMGDSRNNIDANTGGYNYTVRGEILPFGKFASKGDYFGSDLAREKSPKLSIGVTYDNNVDTNLQRGQLGDPLGIERNVNNYVIDAMFKYNGFSFMGEYVDKWVANGETNFEEDASGDRSYFYTGSALNLQTGYLFKNNYEIAGRFTSTNPDEGVEENGDSDRYSLGFSKYISGHTVKVQSTFTYVDYANGNDTNAGDEYQVLLQMEIGF